MSSLPVYNYSEISNSKGNSNFKLDNYHSKFSNRHFAFHKLIHKSVFICHILPSHYLFKNVVACRTKIHRRKLVAYTCLTGGKKLVTALNNNHMDETAEKFQRLCSLDVYMQKLHMSGGKSLDLKPSKMQTINCWRQLFPNISFAVS
jgi:hypothetical protein